MLVSYLEKLRHIRSHSDEADKKLQELIELTKGFHLDADDLNGDKAKSRFMKEKFIKG